MDVYLLVFIFDYMTFFFERTTLFPTWKDFCCSFFCVLKNILHKKLFIYLRKHTSRGRGRGRRKAWISSRLCVECGAQRRARSHFSKIMIWAEIKSWMLNQWGHPGPLSCSFYISMDVSPFLLPKHNIGVAICDHFVFSSIYSLLGL